MTLILSCVTNKYVFQISDRLLTDINTGRPVKVEKNKAVDFWGKAVIGYTGIACKNNIFTDDWISETILNCGSVHEASEMLVETANQHFKGSKYKQAFVITG